MALEFSVMPIWGAPDPALSAFPVPRRQSSGTCNAPEKVIKPLYFSSDYLPLQAIIPEHRQSIYLEEGLRVLAPRLCD
jgi:hypothetical protein